LKNSPTGLKNLIFFCISSRFILPIFVSIKASENLLKILGFDKDSYQLDTEEKPTRSTSISPVNVLKSKVGAEEVNTAARVDMDGRFELTMRHGHIVNYTVSAPYNRSLNDRNLEAAFQIYARMMQDIVEFNVSKKFERDTELAKVALKPEGNLKLAIGPGTSKNGMAELRIEGKHHTTKIQERNDFSENLVIEKIETAVPNPFNIPRVIYPTVLGMSYKVNVKLTGVNTPAVGYFLKTGTNRVFIENGLDTNYTRLVDGSLMAIQDQNKVVTLIKNRLESSQSLQYVEIMPRVMESFYYDTNVKDFSFDFNMLCEIRW